MIDTVDTIEYLQTQSRSSLLELTEYGKYTSRKREAIYDDGNRKYSILEKTTPDLQVNSSRALIEYVKSEFKRRNNEKGNNASLKINLNGGQFVADDDFDEGICRYSRVTSQQWGVLKMMNGEIMNHEQFLMFLLKLSPSIQSFHNVYKSFLKLRIVGNSEMVSNPVFTNGQAESGYLVKYKLEGGQGADAIIPDSFTVSVPYVKASEKKYNVDVDIQVLNNGQNEVRIKVNIPLIENIEETAIIDEINDIKEQLKDYSEMLVLSDI